MPAKNTSFTLGEHFDAYIRQKVETQKYGSASEVVREALRLMEARDAQSAALHAALDQGLASLDAGKSVTHEAVVAGIRTRRAARRKT